MQSFGGALDKTAIYDEEDQLLIISEMSHTPVLPLTYTVVLFTYLTICYLI